MIGQVESDAAVVFGPTQTDNGQLTWEARRRNPDADVFFKPHPDVLHDPRKIATPLEDLAAIAHVLPQHVSMCSALASVDEVYTISSLAGFEALWYGKKVVTLGAPFYAGWGLTEDLAPIARRRRRLTLEQVFAASYLLYPRYHNPMSGERMQLEDALDLLDLARQLRAERARDPEHQMASPLPAARWQS